MNGLLNSTNDPLNDGCHKKTLSDGNTECKRNITAILILASNSLGARASSPHSCGKHAILAGGTPALPVREPTRTAKLRIADNIVRLDNKLDFCYK